MLVVKSTVLIGSGENKITVWSPMLVVKSCVLIEMVMKKIMVWSPLSWSEVMF